MEQTFLDSYFLGKKRKLGLSHSFLLKLFFVINPFLDAITGYLVLSGRIAEGGIGSPSQLFRLIMSVVLLFNIKEKKPLYTIFGIVCYLLIIEGISFLLHGDLHGLFVGIAYSYKLAFGVIVYSIFSIYLKYKLISISVLTKYIVFSGILYSLIVFLSDLLGISFGSYGEGLGSKGVFASGNGLGLYVGLCFLLLICSHKKFTLTYFFSFVLMSYVLLGLMTRASIALLFLGVVLFIIRSPRKYRIPFYMAITLLVFIFVDKLADVILASTEVIVYRYSEASSLQDFIGGRYEYIMRAKNEFSCSGILLYRLFIGAGYFLSFRNPFDLNYGISNILEADIYDVFYMFGIVGLSVYLCLFLYGMYLAALKKNKVLGLIWCLLFFHSAIAGHVVQNGMSVMIGSCILLLLKYNKNECFVSIS